VLGPLLSTPRPEPSHLLPAAGGALVLALALPVFVVSGFPISGWALAAVLWAAVHALDLFVRRARDRTGEKAAAGVQVAALLFKSIGLLVVLFAAVAANRGLALGAAATYALAYTFELALSLAFYFGATRR
jgi:hypothetical protein